MDRRTAIKDILTLGIAPFIVPASSLMNVKVLRPEKPEITFGDISVDYGFNDEYYVKIDAQGRTFEELYDYTKYITNNEAVSSQYGILRNPKYQTYYGQLTIGNNETKLVRRNGKLVTIT